MSLRRSTPMSASRSQAGYTALEILVALTLGSAVAVASVAGYVFSTRSWDAQTLRLQTQQNLRAAIDLLSREVRLAGTCLPDVGPANIEPLVGVDGGLMDTITIRTNVRCAIATLANPAAAGATSITVDTVTNYVGGMQAYILRADTTAGEYVTVANVNQAASTLDLTAPITQNYPGGSSVYGAESQTYTTNTTGPVPVLTVASAQGAPLPVVVGVERLNIRYVLDRNCAPGPCDVVDLPANASEWSLVRTIRLDIGVRSARPVPGGDSDGFYRLGQTIEIKPRNFLF